MKENISTLVFAGLKSALIREVGVCVDAVF
jgi:hypothetical protein